MGNVTPFDRFGKRRASAPSQIELVSHIHQLAVDSANLRFDHPHIRDRMRERNVTMRQVLTVLRQGHAIDEPEQDEYGAWRIKMSRRVAGRKVRVVAAATTKEIVVVTVI